MEDTPGIQGWQWELAVVYTEMLAELVMRGGLSSIQKRALLGTRQTLDGCKYGESLTPPLSSAGLLDMVHFQISDYPTGSMYDTAVQTSFYVFVFWIPTISLELVKSWNTGGGGSLYLKS